MWHAPLGRAHMENRAPLLLVLLGHQVGEDKGAGVKGEGMACLGGKESSPTSCRSRIRSLPILGDPGGSVSYI